LSRFKISALILFGLSLFAASSQAQTSQIPLQCRDSSGSGTTQVCTTVLAVTPVPGDSIIYTTTTTNTGDITVNINNTGPIHIRKWLGSATLASGDLPAATPVLLIYDGTYWEIQTIGNIPIGTGNVSAAVNFPNQGETVVVSSSASKGVQSSPSLFDSSATTGGADWSANAVSFFSALPTAGRGAYTTLAGVTASPTSSVNPFSSTVSELGIQLPPFPISLNSATSPWLIDGSDIDIIGVGESGNGTRLNAAGSFPVATPIVTLGDTSTQRQNLSLRRLSLNCGGGPVGCTSLTAYGLNEGSEITQVNHLGNNSASATAPLALFSGNTAGEGHFLVVDNECGGSGAQDCYQDLSKGASGALFIRNTANNTGKIEGNAGLDFVSISSNNTINFSYGFHAEGFLYGCLFGAHTGGTCDALETSGVNTDALHINAGALTVSSHSLIGFGMNIVNDLSLIPNVVLPVALYSNGIADYSNGTAYFAGLGGHLTTYSGAHTATVTESWINCTTSPTITFNPALIGQLYHVFNNGSGTCTLAASSGNMNGAGVIGGSSITIATATGADVTCDGTNCMANAGGNGGSSGANKALSNLASVAVNLALLPGSDASISLDSTSFRYVNSWWSGVTGWTNGSGTADTGLSRCSAGLVCVGNGTAADVSGTIEATVLEAAPGTHPGLVTLPGNTTNPSIGSNLTGFLGPSSASFTSYVMQLPTTAPSGTQALECATPSSNISTCSFVTPSGAVSSVSNVDGTLTISPTTGAVVASINLAEANAWSAAGTASTPGLSITGAPYTGGSGTTNFPQFYINDGTGPTTFSTAGTEFGINTPSGFVGNLEDFHVNGGASVANLSYLGAWVALTYTADGSTAGFIDFPQGSTSASVAPCNVSTSICVQAPTSVTSYLLDLPGAQPTTNNTFLSCTAANPSVCSWTAGGGVSSIATTSPITGGTITSTGTIACATCVTSAASLTSTAFMTGAGSQGSQTPSATATLSSGGAPTFPGLGTFSAAGGASTPGLTVTGAPYTAGNATTNFPQLYVNDGTGPTTFSTAGTEFGVNTPSGFTGNLADFHVNGAASVANLTYTGAWSALSYTSLGTTAGFIDFPQGTTSASIAPCNATTSACWQAPAAVTSYVLDVPGAAPTNTNSAISCSDANPAVCTFAKMSQTAFLTSNYTNASGAFTNVTGLTFTPEASTSYHMHCNLVWSASAATAGPEYQITGPSTPTHVVIQMVSAVTASTMASAAVTAFSTALNPVGSVVTSSTTEYSTLDMDLINASSTTAIQVQAQNQGTGTLTIEAGSACQLQ
jgi:hypothetical protein